MKQNFIKLRRTLTQVNWRIICLFYTTVLIGTFLARKLPNLLQIVAAQFTEVHLPWNMNHGIAVLLVSFVFYKIAYNKQSAITFFGTNRIKSILFPIVLLLGYGIYGIKNDQGINEHIWAIIFCLFTLVYDIMEEYTWRGFLTENLTPLHFVVKAIISGIFWAIWHILIFENFDQFGGFTIFLTLCIAFSILLTYSVIKTKSLLVPSTIHALFIKTNIVTLTCLIFYMLILITWDKKTILGKN